MEQLDIRDKYLWPMNNIILHNNCTTKTTATCCHPLLDLLDLPRVVASFNTQECTQECIQRRRFQHTEGIQEGPFRPADHSNRLTLSSLMSPGTHQCLSVLSWFLIPLFSHLLHLALFYITNIHIYRLKVRKFMKPSNQNVSTYIKVYANMW
jgi:hypothetical protein